MKEQFDNITLINDDCMNVLRELSDGAFDLAIVDPPYGIGIAKRNGSIGQKTGQGKLTKYFAKEWDNAIPSEEYFTELFRCSKNQIIWGGNYFSSYLPPAKGWIVWDKRQPEGVSFAMAELAYTSFDRSTKMFACSRSLIGNKVSNNDRLARRFIKIHPTQKPVDLYKWVIQNYAKPGDRILDTHLGSNSIGIACHELGFELTGIELDPEYYAAGRQRLINHQMQGKLF